MIEVSHLQKVYDPRSKSANPVLHDISLTLPDTGFVCILGNSGCGKTSLLNAIGGLDDFQGGYVSTDGLKIVPGKHAQADKLRRSTFGYIFQNYYLLQEHSVQYNVYLGLHGVEMSHNEKLDRVNEVLHRVGMEKYAKRRVSELSGGQQQRVAIARALAPSPKVIFADEPTGNLDESNTMNVCSILRSISKDALVVMVTHEARLARFFADRIITIKDGKIESELEDWQRQSLELGGQVYTGDLASAQSEKEGFSIELFRDPNAAAVKLTVVAYEDRIIIKTNDSRTILCSDEQEEPIVNRGKRPTVTLESLEQESLMLSRPNSREKGLPITWKIRETWFLMREKGLYRTGLLIFMAILTVLTCYVYGDWKTITSIDPRDFIASDSHIIEIILDRGENMPAIKYVKDYCEPVLEYLDSTGIPYKFMPTVVTPATNSTELFLQLSEISDSLGGFSYVQLEDLPADSLIMGRMPEKSDEVVIDRWVLDNYLKKDGILQNGIPDISYFLNKSLVYSKKNYSPVIVGICDSGECSMYLPDAGLISLGVGGQEVISLSEFKSCFPEEYGNLELDDESCIMIVNNAGSNYLKEIGGVYRSKSGITFRIADAVFADTYASVIVADSMIPVLFRSMTSTKMRLYCYDRDAIHGALEGELPEGLKDEVQIEVNDSYRTEKAKYEAASKIRADARTIISLTVILLSLSMLFLLRRSQLQKRIGMMAVYRLLGISAYDLLSIYGIEALFVCLISGLPAAAATTVAIQVANSLPSLKFSMLFTASDALMLFGCVFVFFEIISIFPVVGILRKPPAQIAQRM